MTELNGDTPPIPRERKARRIPRSPEGWTRRLRERYDQLAQLDEYKGCTDRDLERKLRRDTLEGFSRLTSAAMTHGHPEFLLRVLRETARVTGLAAGDVNINIANGTSESLPDLSKVPDEELERFLSLAQPVAIETTATRIEEKHGEPERKTRNKRISHRERSDP